MDCINLFVSIFFKNPKKGNSYKKAFSGDSGRKCSGMFECFMVLSSASAQSSFFDSVCVDNRTDRISGKKKKNLVSYGIYTGCGRNARGYMDGGAE